MNNLVMRAIQEMKMSIFLYLFALWFLLESDVRLEVELQVVEKIVSHAHLLKQIALFHEVDIGEFVCRTIQELQAFGQSKERNFISGTIEQDK